MPNWNRSAWTTEALHEHIGVVGGLVALTFWLLIREKDRYAETRFRAQETAIAIAEENARLWRANANEWRGLTTDRERDFARNADVEKQFDAVKEKIDSLATWAAQGYGGRQIWPLLFGAAVVLFGVFELFQRMPKP